MKKLVVLVFHGIGTWHEDLAKPDPEFDRKLRKGLRQRLGPKFDEILWKRVPWSDPVLERRQKDLIVRRAPPRIWRRLFDFVAENLVDASAHMLPQQNDDYFRSAYFRVQQMVRTALREAEAQLPDSESAIPVFAIADSMGCRILSGYAWDAAHAPARVLDQGEDHSQLTPFQRIDGIAGLMFTGCNLPLLTMDIPNNAMMPMKLPLHPLPGKPSFESAWLNLYDGDDVLGYPIEQEFTPYFNDDHVHKHRFPEWKRDPAKERKPRDEMVRVKHIFGFTPYAHVQYLNSGSVIDRAAAEIGRLLAAL